MVGPLDICVCIAKEIKKKYIKHRILIRLIFDMLYLALDSGVKHHNPNPRQATF